MYEEWIYLWMLTTISKPRGKSNYFIDLGNRWIGDTELEESNEAEYFKINLLLYSPFKNAISNIYIYIYISNAYNNCSTSVSINISSVELCHPSSTTMENIDSVKTQLWPRSQKLWVAVLPAAFEFAFTLIMSQEVCLIITSIHCTQP